MLVYWCTPTKKKTNQQERKRGVREWKKKSTRILSDELPKKIIKFWRIIERNIALVQRQTVPAYIYISIFAYLQHVPFHYVK